MIQELKCDFAVERPECIFEIEIVDRIVPISGAIGRMFDYGNVTVRGTGGLEELFETIASPLQFRNWVQRLQSGLPSR